jgi:hypothetical protein
MSTTNNWSDNTTGGAPSWSDNVVTLVAVAVKLYRRVVNVINSVVQRF